MTEEVKELWPQLDLIQNADLRRKTAEVWELALAESKLDSADLYEIPFTLLVKDCPVTFMEHKRAVVDISYESAKVMKKYFGDNLPINMDTVVSGAILCDVGKLLEYDKVDGKAVVSDYGRYVRHPFSGVGLAMRVELPAEICHIIAAHAGEGDKVKRSAEAFIVHHADFMSFLPFMNR